ncbi:MAG TPA: TonB-dependent receptor [Rhizomicrobium sp.]|nr:TonB-dependent receptor [Rhizomicrobium sp.]
MHGVEAQASGRRIASNLSGFRFARMPIVGLSEMSRSLLLASVAGAALFFNAPAFAQIAGQGSGSIETVVVTASPFAEAADQYASIVNSVDRDEIIKQGGANLADSLKDIPGLAGTGFAAGASRPVIRGMDATRVKVLENGLSSADVSDIGPDHGVPIDPMIVQRLEVVSGAAALRYGSQAIGGVVNAIDNRIPLSLPSEFSGEANASYDSAADGTQVGAMADDALGQFAFHGDAFIRRDGNYDTPLGTQINSYSHQDGFSGGTSYFFGDSRAGASVSHFDANYGIPSDTTHIIMRQTKINTDESLAVDTGPLKTINIQAEYSWYGHTENEPDGSIDSTFLNKELDSHIEALFGPMGPFSNTAVGVQIQNRKYQALGEDSDYLFPTQTQTESGYVFTEVPLSTDLKIQAAGRLERVHITGTPASDVYTGRDFTPLSGSVALLWTVTDDTKFGLTLTSAGRAPAQTELFARGGHDGPETFETGDPSLKIERSNSLEGTVRTKLGPVSLEGSLWGSRFNNYIYGNLTGLTCTDDGVCGPGDFGDLKQLFYRQADASFWGLEGKASMPLLDRSSGTLSANMLADYVRASLGSGLGNVPRIQPFRVGGGLDWNSTAFDASLFVLGVGAQNVVGAFDPPTPGYIDVSLQGGWRPFSDNSGFEIDVIAHNLTNQVERDAVALNKEDVVAPGRDFRIVLRQAF